MLRKPIFELALKRASCFFKCTSSMSFSITHTRSSFTNFTLSCLLYLLEWECCLGSFKPWPLMVEAFLPPCLTFNKESLSLTCLKCLRRPWNHFEPPLISVLNSFDLERSLAPGQFILTNLTQNEAWWGGILPRMAECYALFQFRKCSHRPSSSKINN